VQNQEFFIAGILPNRRYEDQCQQTQSFGFQSKITLMEYNKHLQASKNSSLITLLAPYLGDQNQ
jgi:hypothetical protein